MLRKHLEPESISDASDNSSGLFDFVPGPLSAAYEPNAPRMSPDGGLAVPLRTARAQKALEAFVVVVIALSPIPAASNRPGFWLIWAALILIVFGAYVLLARKTGAGTARRYRWLGACAATFASFALLQTLPLAAVLPDVLRMWEGPRRSISLMPDATLVATLKWASYGLFFVLCAEVARNRDRARSLCWLAFYAVAVHAILAMGVFRFLGIDGYLGPDRYFPGVVTGSFLNRNSFATFLGMGAILGLSLLLRDAARSGAGARRVWSPETLTVIVRWTLLILILAAIFMTASRMGVATTVAGTVLASVLILGKSGGSRRRLFLLAGPAVLVAVAYIAFFGQPLVDRSVFVFAQADTRLELYRLVVGIIRDNPLFGTGLGTFEIAIENAYAPPLSPDFDWSKSHSTYLALWSEMGLLFGSLPMAIVAILAIRFASRDLRFHRDFLCAIVALAVIVQTSLHALVDFSLEIPANAYLFTFLLALAFGRVAHKGDPVAPGEGPTLIDPGPSPVSNNL
jgi:O-antigen ligase